MKQSKALLVVIVLSASVLQACIKYVQPGLDRSGEMREYVVGFEVVWSAVVRTFAEKNIQIKTIDKTSGIIASEPVRGTIGSHLDCGSLETAGGINRIVGQGLGIFNVFVQRQSDSSTSVKVNSRWSTIYRHYDLYGRLVSSTNLECSSTGEFEYDILKFIEDGVGVVK